MVSKIDGQDAQRWPHGFAQGGRRLAAQHLRGQCAAGQGTHSAYI